MKKDAYEYFIAAIIVIALLILISSFDDTVAQQEIAQQATDDAIKAYQDQVAKDRMNELMVQAEYMTGFEARIK
jgi:hypothetical protein